MGSFLINPYRYGTWTANNGTLSAQDANLRMYYAYDGADASTTFTDTTGNFTVTTTAGNAQLDTSDKQLGTASLLLDGSGDYLIMNDVSSYLDFPGDFTLSFWTRFVFANNNFYNRMIAFATDANPHISLETTTTSGEVRVTRDASASNTITGISDNAWHHFVAQRIGSTFKVYVDNTEKISVTDSTSFSTTSLMVGRFYGSEGFYLNGRVDELAIWKGYGATTSFITALYNSGTGSQYKG